MDVQRYVKRDPSSTKEFCSVLFCSVLFNDLAGLAALLDTFVIVLAGILTLRYLRRMNTCRLCCIIEPSGFIVNKHTHILPLPCGLSGFLAKG